jgi:hypothetical protein
VQAHESAVDPSEKNLKVGAATLVWGEDIDAFANMFGKVIVDCFDSTFTVAFEGRYC